MIRYYRGENSELMSTSESWMVERRCRACDRWITACGMLAGVVLLLLATVFFMKWGPSRLGL